MQILLPVTNGANTKSGITHDVQNVADHGAKTIGAVAGTIHNVANNAYDGTTQASTSLLKSTLAAPGRLFNGIWSTASSLGSVVSGTTSSLAGSTMNGYSSSSMGQHNASQNPTGNAGNKKKKTK